MDSGLRKALRWGALGGGIGGGGNGKTLDEEEDDDDDDGDGREERNPAELGFEICG